MGKYCDFVVDYAEDETVLAKSIIGNIFVNRIKYKKPTVVLLTGDPGEGKSYTALILSKYILANYGLKLADYLEDIEVFTPLQYRDKMDNLLHNKKLKKVKVIILDEAREVISAKDWLTFINRSIADINALFRRVKPMVVIIVTQYTGDIDKAVRRSVTFWGKCLRPLGKRPRLYLYRTWKDERDLENPKMRRRRLMGYVKKDRRYFKIRPEFQLSPLDANIAKRYEDLNYKAKAKIIRAKLDALLHLLQKDLKVPFEKVESMADFYANKPELLGMVIEKRGNKIVLKKDFDKMHELTRDEKTEFHDRLTKKLIEKGVANAISEKKTD